ncbi:MAG: M16 family metallopeptidase [Dehalococcoidia bacterium]
MAHQRVVLDNGLAVLTASIPHTPSVSMAVFVGAGSRYEADRIAGVSHFLEHLLFKGSRLFPTAVQVSEAIEGVGGMMNAGTEREMTVYWVKVAKPHFPRAITLLADMILHPLLHPQEMEKERQVILEELRMSNDYPAHRVDLLLDQLLWPDQPMGRDVGGTIESVQAISRKDVLEYMGHQYIPTNVLVVVAGDLSHREMVESVRQSLQEWKPAEKPLAWYPAKNAQQAPRLKVEQRKTEQAHIALGIPGLPLHHPRRYALNLMSVILGEGMSSRLFVEVREKRGLAYDVHSMVAHFRDCGSVVTYCGVEPTKASFAIETILGELERLKESSVPQEELDKAKEFSKGRLLLRMEDTRSVAMWMGAQELLLGKVTTVEQVLKKVDAVTAEDVQAVAQQLLRPETFNLAVVGPYRSDRRFARLLHQYRS